MRDMFWPKILGLIVLIAAMIALVAYLGRPKLSVIPTEALAKGTAEQVVATNDHGQSVAEVRVDCITKWLAQHRDRKIVSICSVDCGTYGATSSFLVVYEEAKAKPEKE